MTGENNFTPVSERGKILAPMIDHTLLKADASESRIIELCAQARFYSFASVCVNPGMAQLAAKELAGSNVKVCSVIGFPLGATTMPAKAFETSNVVQNGVHEVDMVLNIAALKARNEEYVQTEIRSVVRCAHKRIVKVILETCLLTDEEKEIACRLTMDAGAHFVKTSTGLAGGGATVEDVRLLRRAVGKDFGVKASGGIKTYDDAVKMVAAGANRIGTSSGVAIATA